MRAHVHITAKLPANRDRFFDQLTDANIRLSTEEHSPVLTRNELLALPSDQTTELFVTNDYGIDAIRNAKYVAHLIQEAGGEALVVGEKTVTTKADKPGLVTTNSKFSEQLKKLIEAKKFEPGIVIPDEITLAAKTYDEAEDRILAAPTIR
ncbi:hypothetical protein [Rhizobium sp. MHM7A]|uniref:hypothetical protein n=1 Tax=Rhizobium sp. MHM7A TaxID=2583233 RepID=UPI001106D4C3|nr:hypothetical protein [Rhizobium sp. MHM7A]TLX15947.1 hypothetical protein FFR93_01120 [Rhizobium sp. MHM7A]